MSRIVRRLIVLGVLMLGACTESEPSVASLPDGSGSALRATVVAVTDGDTVELALPGAGVQRARLLGIDTPETVDPDEPVGCFGPEASARTHQLLPDGAAVLVQRDEEARDRYGRLLVYLWVEADGTFVNRTLVDEGLARTLSIEPNTTHRAELAASEAAARSAGRGLWSACPADSVGP